jgi:hypothetical protein
VHYHSLAHAHAHAHIIYTAAVTDLHDLNCPQRDGTVSHANMSPFYLEKRLASPANCGETFHVFTLLLAAVREGIECEDSVGKCCECFCSDLIQVTDCACDGDGDALSYIYISMLLQAFTLA